MNDIHTCSDLFNFILYADDTTLVNSETHSKSNNVPEIISFELKKFTFAFLEIKISIKKSKFMICRSKQKVLDGTIIIIQLHGILIDKVSDLNFLVSR